MTEPNDVQAIEKISAVVGESQIKIIFSNQCIKAQAFLVNRLKRQIEHQKQVSKFISSDNLKLEVEIKNAEQEIKSLMLAHESIKSANVELKKECQLAKEMVQETAERIQIGEKKYDELWEQCKSRYESIGFVQNWLQGKEKKESLEENIKDLHKQTQGILEEIKIKNNMISELNKKRIIELADFFIHERPKTLEQVSILSKELKELNSQVEKLLKSQVVQESLSKDAMDSTDATPRPESQRLSVKIDDGWPNLNKNLTSNVNTMMPKLQLMNIDLDVMSVKLDQIKKSDSGYEVGFKSSPIKEANSEQKTVETGPKLTLTPAKRQNEYVSLYFHKSANIPSTSDDTEGSSSYNYSKRKLINIIEDMKLDKTDTYEIVSKVNLDNLQEVSVITANVNKNNESVSEPTKEKNQSDAQDAEIEEIDLTPSNVEQILLPPSGFLDQLRSSQEKKKKVSFELPTSAQEDAKGIPKNDVDGENESNVTINSSLDESEENFTKIKDMILKKHNLDLSPQFVYGKNTTILIKNDEVVKSNYFKLSCEELQPSTSGTHTGTVELPNEADENEMDCDQEAIQTNVVNNETVGHVEMEVNENDISNEKVVPANQEQNIAKPVAGLLFSHGPLGLPDSLDVSISTTGFEDGDYPQYSSLLLSPKADLPIPLTNEKVETEVISQDLPNFLSGLRKTGLSFFGKMTGTANTDNDSAPTDRNNFNFAFGGDDKKNRGGLFNMFN